MTLHDEIIQRNNVTSIGAGKHTLLLAHGFGCDQNMWRYMVPELSKHYRLVLFDYVGSGNSDKTAFERAKYQSLDGYARDLIDVCLALDLRQVTIVGHSVSSMIGLIASIKSPQYFANMIMVCPSPYFLNDPPDYYGGFEREDLVELINLMDKNYIGWANYLAPLVMGANQSADLVEELAGSFCSTDPVTAKAFANATFFSDCRDLLGKAKHPALILQSRQDALASVSIGKFVQSAMPNSEIDIIEAEGHCLHMSCPDQVHDRIVRYLGT